MYKINNKQKAIKEIDDYPLRIDLISDELKDDDDIADFSIKKSPSTFQYLSQRIKNDRKRCLQAIKLSPFPYRFFPKNHQSDREIILELCKFNVGMSLEFIPQEIFEDRNFLKQLIELSPSVFKFLNDDYKSDEEIASFSIKNEPTNGFYASQKLMENPKFFLKVAEMNQNVGCGFFSINHRNSLSLLLKLSKLGCKINNFYGKFSKNRLIQSILNSNKYEIDFRNKKSSFNSILILM